MRQQSPRDGRNYIPEIGIHYLERVREVDNLGIPGSTRFRTATHAARIAGSNMVATNWRHVPYFALLPDAHHYVPALAPRLAFEKARKPPLAKNAVPRQPVAMSLLEVRGLTTAFQTGSGEIAAAEDIAFDLDQGEVLGIVGESGSGKSVTALTIMGLLPRPPARIVAGSIRFDGQELTTLPDKAMQRIRGPGIAMVFQEPMTSLNPVFTIGDQIMETIRAHERLSGRDVFNRAVEMLEKVGIPSAAQRMADYRHQLSGGQRQRVMLAIALVCRPRILIADEPTTALDVTVQAQILDLLLDLRDEFGMAIMLITHNMGVIAETADRVLVMYAGRVVEEAPIARLFDDPRHPYTRGLLECVPSLVTERERLIAIPGTLPEPARRPPGCRFAPRCRHAIAACSAGLPPLTEQGPGHTAACIRIAELATP